MRHDVSYPIAFVLLACACHAAADDSLIPERRRPRFQSEFGYAVFPFPYSLPGIGSGLSVVGGAMNVAGTHAAQRELCFNLIDNVVADNTYGAASSLGGFNRLRSYSAGRYQGAHTLFVGTEARWNLTDEFTPFNLYFIKDVRTAIQLSAFYEIGSVAERQSDIGDTTRSSLPGRRPRNSRCRCRRSARSGGQACARTAWPALPAPGGA